VRARHAHRTAMRAELGIGDHEIVVATVANYRTQKAWPDLLAAAALVIGARPDVRFVGVGQGQLAAAVEQQHRDLHLGERFLLLGQRPDAVTVLAAADVFTLASRYEGYPVALMEALALGLPVVATAVGGVPDAVPHEVAGLLVRPGAPHELAAAIGMVTDDGGLRRRLAAGARHAGDRFDIRQAAGHLERIYRQTARRYAPRDSVP
jgi:L-malate glycosyltransferase